MKQFLNCLLLVGLVTLFTISCKIGLGSAVDTEAPVVEISKPDVGAIIRDSFAIGGIWSDDGDIKADGLKVTLERTDGSTSPVTYQGSFDVTSGTWNCAINPLDTENKLLDGEYQATIAMTDTYEHTTKKTLTFTIDNTPPVVVLQRPSADAQKSDTPDSYGQSFTLEGQAADDNNVDLVEVNIYSDKECKTLVHTVKLNNVPPTISLDVAKFIEGEENDYSKIYGSTTKNGAKPFYCQIIAYDGAQKYPVDGTAQTADDEKGNASTFYYLYEDISAAILSNYKITELYAMNSGNYSGGEGENRAARVSEVKDILSKNIISTGYFSLNPANNPSFVVSGRNPLTKGVDNFATDKVSEWEITSGTKVQVEVSTGLDGIPLKADTLGVYVIECDGYGKPLVSAKKIQIISPKVDKKGNAILTDATKISARAALISKSGTSYKFTTLLDTTTNPELQFSHGYIFGVDGYDENGNDISDFGNPYGFYFVSNGSAPKLEVTGPANGITYNKKGSSLIVKGTAQAEVAYPNLTIKVVNQNGSEVYTKTFLSADMEGDPDITTSQPNGKQKIEFEHTIPSDKFSQTESMQYALTIIASNGEKDTTIDRTILYDVAGPIISIEEVTPETPKYKAMTNFTRATEKQEEVETGTYINGNISLKLSITDAYDVVETTAPDAGETDFRPYFEIIDLSTSTPLPITLKGATESKDKIYITAPAKQIFEIDTTNIDGKHVKLVVHGWDRAHNAGTVSEKEYYVDQVTDNPIIFPSNYATFTLTFADSSNLDATNVDKLNVLPSGSSMGITLVDDDGIKNYKFEIGDRNSSDENTLKVPSECDAKNGGNVGIEPSGSPKSIPFTYTLPTDGGDYMCRMTVKDLNGKIVTKKFWIRITGAAPALTSDCIPSDKIITTATSNISADAKKSLKVTIHISSEYPPFKVERKEAGISTPVDLGEWSNCDDFDDEFTPSSNRTGNVVTYTFTDSNHHAGSIDISYYVDSNRPTITSIKTPSVTETEAVSTRFVANAEDSALQNERSSGVSKIEYTFDSSKADTNIRTIPGVLSLDDVFIFNQTPDYGFAQTTEGKKKIYVRATDAVGNVGEWKEQEFTYDTAKPVIKIEKYGDANNTPGTSIENETFDIGKLFSISGTAKDNYGIKSVKVTESKKKADGSYDTPVDVETVTGTISWSVPKLPKSGNAETGTYLYKVTVTDSADKENSATLTVNVDTEAPTISISAPTDKEIFSGSTTVFGGSINDGTDSANQGVKYIYYAITDSSTAPTASVTDTSKWTRIDKTTIGKTQTTWDLNRNLGTGKAPATPAENTIYEGEWYFHVKAEDKAGNITQNAVTKHFYVDQAKPEISDVKNGENSLVEGGQYFYSSDTATSFEIKGKIVESNELSTFKAKINNNTPVDITTPTASANPQDWSYTINNVAKDTLTKILITAKDPCRPEVTKEYTIYNDTKAPDISITTPDKDVDGQDALSADKYTFRGNITDAGSGLKDGTYKYAFSKTELSDEAAIINDIKSQTPSVSWEEYSGGQVFTIEKELVSGTDEVSGKLCEGQWYLYIYAKDSVGHESAQKRTFWVDKSKPTVTTKVDSGTKEEKSTDYTYKFDKTTDIKTGSFTVYYKADDTHGLKTDGVSIVVKNGDGTELTKDTHFTVGTKDANDFYPISLVSASKDSDYTFEIKAEDKAGKTTTVTRTIRLDTVGPEIEINSPNFDNWQTSGNVKIVGTAIDATEVSKVYYSLNPASEPTVGTWTDWKEATGTSNWSIDLKDVPDSSTNKLYISSVDSNGNITSKIEKTLKVDKTSPTPNETDIGMKGISILAEKTSLSLKGTYTEETSGIKSIIITDSENSNSSWTVTTDTTKKEWSCTIPLGTGNGKLTNGEHTLTITAEDEAGNTGKIQRSVQIDTMKPSVGTLSVTTSSTYTDNTTEQNKWYNTSQVAIKIDGISDTKLDGYSSEIAAVEYQVVYAGVSATEATWISMTPQTTSGEYTANVNCPVQGLNTINVRVKDNAGNEGSQKTVQVYIDTGAPETPKNWWVELADTATENASANFTSQLLTNKTKKVHVLLVTSDKNSQGTLTSSGIKQIVKGESTTSIVTTTSTFTPKGGTEQTVYDLAISTDDCVDGKCTIKIIDNVGNETIWEPFSFKVDTNKPSISLGQITDADTSNDKGIDVNGKLTITINASDDFGLPETDPVVLKYKVGGDSAPTDWSSITDKLTVDTTKSPWEATVDTTATGFTDKSNLYLQLSCTDKAGNSTNPITKTLYINQDSDRPVIKFTNLTYENGKYLLKYGDNSTLEGIVTDDDGTSSAVVKEFIASDTAINPSTKANKTGTTSFTPASGDFKFVPADKNDGEKVVYFYVKDNNDKEFYTTATTNLLNPYQQYKSDTKTDNNAVFNYKSDSTSPVISETSLQAFNKASGSAAADKEGPATGLGATCIVGGTKKTYIEVSITTTDSNGIAEIEVELSDGTNTKTLKKSVSGDFTTSGNVYTTKRIELSDFAAIADGSTGNVTVKIKVTDGAGLYSNQESLFVVDKKPAKITNITQSAEDLYGSVKFAVSGQPSETDVSKVYYGFTSSETEPTTWTEIQNQKLSVNLVFDGDLTSTVDGVHGKTLRNYILDAYSLTDAELSADDTKKDLYIHFKVEDECGNVGYSNQKYSVIPNGDLPTLKLTYPEDITANTKVGGTLRCAGTTDIGPGNTVNAVYAQIDISATSKSSTWSSSWESTLTAFTDKYTIEDTGVKNDDTLKRGIKVSGSPYSWNMAINGSTEFNTDSDKLLAVRFFAVSSTGKASEVTTLGIEIDPNAPIFSDLKLIQETDAKSQAYSDDMWIKGQWYLTGKLSDDSGVKYISYFDNANVETILVEKDNDTTGHITTAGTGKVTQAEQKGSAYNYTFKIPIGNTTDGAFGSITYRIEAIDATGDNNLATKTFTVNYDNKAPVFKAVTNSASDTELAATGLSIKQSSGGYTIDGKFDEEGTANANQSGFGRIVMYFTRTVGSTTNIIDPSVTKVKTSNNDNKNNYLALTGLTLDSTDGIYWKQMSASKIEETCKLTVASLPDYVRVGGVCKIDGILYRIIDVSSGVVTVDGVLDNTTTAKTVYFTPALVIDNFSTEAIKSGETYDGIYQTSDDTAKLTNGDGDWLIEGVSKSGSSYPWTVTINSANILDGPIDIHLTAYDAAGNVAKKTYSGSIANNAPRIAGVTVWTDYNGDNEGWRSTQTGYEDEAKSYYATQVRPNIDGKQVYRSKDVVDSLIISADGKVTNTTKGEGKAFMKITDQVKVIPEIVGGNGALGYTYNLSGNGVPASNAPAGTGSALTKDDGTTTVDGTDASASLPTKTDADSVTYIDGNTDGVITFDTTNVISKLSNSSTENPTWFNIKIWDSTEGGTQYTNTLNCEMKIALNVQYKDEISPKVVVSPFKWEGPTENSLVLDGDDKTCGHIELEDDLPSSFTTGGTGVNDRDPKVSGLIVIRGTAYDDIRLNKLYVSFGDHSKISTKTEAATYSNGVWTSESAEPALSSTVTINDQISNLKTKGWTFSAEDEYINSEGHKVNWELKIDTSLVSGVAALDKSFTIYADDARGTTTKSSSTTNSGTSGDITSYNKPTYKMDIVPYITEVVTKLASKGGISYSRTALGHYPIATDETSVTLKGYNLASGNADKIIDPHLRETGVYNLTINGVESFNNKNNNNAMGTFDGTGQSDAKKLAAKYNMQPDSSINNNLTDDIYFDMWELNSNAATSGYPSLKYPVMHIDPTGDRNKIGFGFVKGSDSVSFPAAGKSYTWYQKNRKDYVSTNFVYDAKGVAHTISIGLDGQFDTGIAGRMNYSSSNWYDANNNSGRVVKQWDTRYNVGLESIGIPNGVVIKGSKLNDTSGQGIIDIERFNTPSIAVASHGDNTAVYIMYYDSQNDQIRFRYGLVANNLTNRGHTQISYNAGYRANEQFGLLNDSKSEQQRCTSVNQNNANTQYIHSDEGNTGEDYNKHGMFEASKDYYALVTGQYYKQDHNNQAAFNTGNNGSMYCSMDVVAATGTNETMNDDKVVIVWYDPTTKNLMYIYRENLGADNNNVSNVSASTTAVSSGGSSRWSAPKTILTGKPVQDVTIKVDSLGGIHIAAYDQNNADLIYMYTKNYQAEKVYSCTVDAYSQVGKSITIDVPLNSDGKAVPYISYYAEGLSSLPKLAYLPGGIDITSDDTIEDSIGDGANAGTKLFSQKWEVTLIPTSSALQSPTASHSADVMIGTFRDENGTIAKPSAGTDVVTSQDERTRYANGSTDLVVGYSIKTNGIGYIETAMRK